MFRSGALDKSGWGAAIPYVRMLALTMPEQEVRQLITADGYFVVDVEGNIVTGRHPGHVYLARFRTGYRVEPVFSGEDGYFKEGCKHDDLAGAIRVR